MLEATYVSQDGLRLARNTRISDDRFIAGLAKVADAIHREGGKAALQINNGGREAVTKVSGSVPLGPSSHGIVLYQRRKGIPATRNDSRRHIAHRAVVPERGGARVESTRSRSTRRTVIF